MLLNKKNNYKNKFIDFCDYNCGKYHAGCVSTVRVQLLDGTFHEDIGYSTTENQFKGLAIFNARSVNLIHLFTLICFDGFNYINLSCF